MKTTDPLPSLPPRRILIAEDDLLAAHSLKTALTIEHHVVEVAVDGEQALALFEAQHFDVVIADFKIPKIDGLELAEAVKQRVPSCPVILITAYAETVGSKTGEVSNVDILLGKPVTMQKLLEALREVHFMGLGARTVRASVA